MSEKCLPVVLHKIGSKVIMFLQSQWRPLWTVPSLQGSLSLAVIEILSCDAHSNEVYLRVQCSALLSVMRTLLKAMFWLLCMCEVKLVEQILEIRDIDQTTRFCGTVDLMLPKMVLTFIIGLWMRKIWLKCDLVSLTLRSLSFSLRVCTFGVFRGNTLTTIKIRATEQHFSEIPPSLSNNSVKIVNVIGL